MLNRVITVDFGKKNGKIKPVNGINGGPRSGGCGLPFDFSEEFVEMGIPVVRTGASAGEYGLNQFINVHCIFPDPDADPELEESYNFLPTDLYLASVKNTGAEIFYRLGESPEPYSRKLYAHPPKDAEKWASVCEHIIMHYNEQWANGFKLGIKNWEIWSAADSSVGMQGEPREYFELYRITANRLRERFPRIKIGAYGQSGFYSLNRLDATEEMKTYIPFMQQFLAYINRPETSAPLDFFTWTCRTSNPDELAMHIKYARSYLDAAGHKRTKSIISEYNSVKRGGVPIALRADFPSELAASLILAQKSSVDMMFYSTSDITSEDNGFFSIQDYRDHHRYCAYNVMCAFGKLYKIGTAVETTGDYRKEVYSLAAFNKKEAAILLATREYSGRVEVVLKGQSFTSCSVVKTVPGAERGTGNVYRAENIAVTGGRIIIPAKKNEIYFITLIPSEDSESDADL